MRIVIALLLVVVAAGLGWAPPAQAQGSDGASFLDPFPEGDRYRVQVYGDAMAEGLLEGLAELMAQEPRFAIEKKNRWLGGLMKSDADQEAKTIEGALGTSPPHIAIFMLGAGDRVAFRRPNGRRAGVGSDEWKEEYARRLDLVMRAVRKRSVAVFWVGLPVMRREDANDDAEMMNELFRSRALANGVRFVDIFASFADADKSYDAHGPDIAGKTRLLREPDGVHFTWAGHRKLAYFVERELKRAAQQAWDERTIPLAGSESEQSRIRPPTTVKLAPVGSQAKDRQAAAAAPSALAGAAVPGRPSAAGQAGDGVSADHSRITMRTIGEQGREESVTVEILRPAIPAAVVALLTRREADDKASQVGEPVMTEILGGLTVVSAVTPLAEPTGERRRATDGASPALRVLQRGETLSPKPGRADEMPWPRPEATVAAASEAPPAPAATPAPTPARGRQAPASQDRAAPQRNRGAAGQ